MDKAPPGKWEGGVGYLTEEIAKQQLPEPSDDNLVLVCGPPPMMKAISGEKAPDKSQGQLAVCSPKMAGCLLTDVRCSPSGQATAPLAEYSSRQGQEIVN